MTSFEGDDGRGFPGFHGSPDGRISSAPVFFSRRQTLPRSWSSFLRGPSIDFEKSRRSLRRRRPAIPGPPSAGTREGSPSLCPPAPCLQTPNKQNAARTQQQWRKPPHQNPSPTYDTIPRRGRWCTDGLNSRSRCCKPTWPPPPALAATPFETPPW